MTRDEVVTLMKSSTSKQEWDDNCDVVKRACSGYPNFWYPVIIRSGLYVKVANSWGGDPHIKIK